MNGGAWFEKILRPLRLDSPLQLFNFTKCLQFFSDRLLVLSVEMYGFRYDAINNFEEAEITDFILET